MKRVKISRKRKEKNRDKNEKDENEILNRELLFSKRNIPNKGNKNKEKEEFVLENMLKTTKKE